ncbi:peptide chain release factor N(5)-glutamine methyltransferase [Tsuneonella suprasediminis]|uniref:Release factor glutamine methyltransferase n=1 Tax=Tsuneonella suprasediminis TaxID=2306996 RepID=A0A419R1B2_9SPHN|nr:peptide chain release factor N(5)-glutamine methyltransferase [Tsuneonella suprasediminis]RJX67746.1 peptide chain release factor N(5)-glutamine methyltransferase [Tsuneonella suprasediminis]
MTSTVGAALRDATARLGEEWARIDAELLMAHALGMTRSAMLIGAMRDPAPAGFAPLLERRLAGEPVAYILGTAEFYGRTFSVSPDVLIPRADSESVVAAALEAKPDACRVLDCGTGSGALLLTLLAELPAAHGIGIDRSEAALRIATANAAELNLADRARFELADWTVDGWADGLGRFDLVIANPPYVSLGALPGEFDALLDENVQMYEPAGALFAGPEGLDDYRILVPQLKNLLEPSGVAVLEIGATQAGEVTVMSHEAGFAVTLRHDLAGRPRGLILT